MRTLSVRKVHEQLPGCATSQASGTSCTSSGPAPASSSCSKVVWQVQIGWSIGAAAGRETAVVNKLRVWLPVYEHASTCNRAYHDALQHRHYAEWLQMPPELPANGDNSVHGSRASVHRTCSAVHEGLQKKSASPPREHV